MEVKIKSGDNFCLKEMEELLVAMEYLYARYLQFPREYARFEALSAMLPLAKQTAETLKTVCVDGSVAVCDCAKRLQDAFNRVREDLVHEIERVSTEPFEIMLQIAKEWAASKAVDETVFEERKDELTYLLAFAPTEKAILDFIAQAERDVPCYNEEKAKIDTQMERISARAADLKKRFQAGEITREEAMLVVQSLQEEREAFIKALEALDKSMQYAGYRDGVAHSLRRLQFETFAELSYWERSVHFQKVDGAAVINRLIRLFSAEVVDPSACFDGQIEIEALIEKLEKSIRGEEEEPWLIDDEQTI